MNHLLNVKDVCAAMGGVSKSSVYNLVRARLLTEQVHPMGGRASRWLKSELDAILAAQIAGKSKDDIKALVADLHAKRGGAV